MTSRAEALEGRYIKITALVLAPFSAGYFLSYLFRTVNSVIGDLLRTEFSLSNSDVGLMTAAYLLGFGLCQVPLGMLLDRYGPRRVNAVLLMIAASGAAIFALSTSAVSLFIGRGLIGIGVSSALMSSFKAVNQWYPSDRWAAMNGVILVMGGLGAVVGSEPIQAALVLTDWRTLFFILAAVTAFVALMIFVIVPDRQETGEPETLRELWRGMVRVYSSRAFWGLMPIALTTMGIGLAIQGLWAGLWLSDVDGLNASDKARILLYLNLGLMVGYFGTGFAAQFVRRYTGIGPGPFMLLLLLIYCADQLLVILNVWPASGMLWFVFGLLSGAGLLSFPMLAAAFPLAYAGRCNTAINLWIFVGAFAAQFGIGAITDLFGRQANGAYSPEAYQAAFGVVLAIQVLSLVWYLLIYRSGPPHPAENTQPKPEAA